MSRQNKLVVKPVPDQDLRAFHEIRRNYVSGHETWEDTLYHYEKWSDLTVAAYLDDPAAIFEGKAKGEWRDIPEPENLIGVAVGRPEEEGWGVPASGPSANDRESIGLVSIAIDFPYRWRGYGSRLLNYFEGQVAKMGRKRVVVGAAPNVDAFYLANNYHIVQYYLRVVASKLPDDFENLGYEIGRVEDEGLGMVSIHIPTSRYEPEAREQIRKAFNAEFVSYTYEKEV